MSSAFDVVFLKWLEPVVTAGSGVYALAKPEQFFSLLLPPGQRDLPGGAALHAIEYSVRLYALVLVLLGLAEHLVFRIQGELRSKTALLIAMLLADLIHIYVVTWTWFAGPYAVLLSDISSLLPRDFLSLAGNVLLVAWAAIVRVKYLSSSRSKLE